MASNKMLIDASHPEETRVAVVRGNRIEEFDFESQAKKQLRGNVYLAKVTRVEPSLQAAFIDYGGNRHGFLAFSEIHPDYYQIPVADRLALLEEEARQPDENGDNNGEIDASANDTDYESEETAASQDKRRKSRRGRSGKKASEKKRSSSASPNEDDAAPQDTAIADSDDVAAQENSADPEDNNGNRSMAAAHVADAISEPAPDPEESDHDDISESSGTTEPDEKQSDVKDTAGEDAEPARKPRRRRATRKAKKEEPKEEDVSSQTEQEAQTESSGSTEDSKPAKTAKPRRKTARKKAAPKEEPPVEEISVAPEMPAEEETVESVGQEDALEEVPQRHKPRRQYKIQEVIKRRQIMLVQVVKEERGNKGAALTTYLSLAGRYSVLMPNTARGGGISRKITNANDRKRLKTIAADLDIQKGMGVILRTAGATRTKAEIKRDFEYLVRLWENVRALTLSSTAPCLVYEEGSLIKRSIRDLYNKDIGEILVSGNEGYREAKDFMRMLMPSHAKNVKAYTEEQSLFSRFGVEQQLDRLLSAQVTLKSGGYLVINQTEALVSIDVNSGRSTREHSIEDTAVQTNLEASDEIARQLRLRDLAGLIVIDFIDMEENKNNRAVEKRLKDALKNDRARIQVGRISHFGLLEMSRQRIRTSVMESTMDVCPHCDGSGYIRSDSSIALHVFRSIEDHLTRHSNYDVVVRCPTRIALDILNHKRSGLLELESRFGVKIIVSGDPALPGQSFVVERGEAAHRPVDRKEHIHSGSVAIEDDANEKPVEDADEETENVQSNRSGSRVRKDRSPDKETGDQPDAEDPDAENILDATDDEDSKPRRKRRRGKRGGRRKRKETEEETASEAMSADEAADESANDNFSIARRETENTTTETAVPAAKEPPQKSTAQSAESEHEEELALANMASSDPVNSDETTERARNTRRPKNSQPSDDDSNDQDSNKPAEDKAEATKPKKSGWWSRGSGFF
jgi:ribonuclease E